MTERKGWWKFDNTNSLTTPVNGYDKASLTLVGSHVAVGGYEEGDGAVLIGVGNHNVLNHPIAPSVGGLVFSLNKYN